MKAMSCTLTAIACALLAFKSASSAGVQPPTRGCVPVSERAGQDVGCWILASQPLGELSQPAVFWHLDAFPTRAAAESAKGPGSTVVEALGKVWLLTIGEAGWRPQAGVRVAEIGPIPVKPGQAYTAHYMEGISNPGDVIPQHRHPGPEAWYTAAGGFCAETPGGKLEARAGKGTVIPADTDGWSRMMLVATGAEVRRSLVLVLHQSALPWTAPVSDWTPRGLCIPDQRH